MLLLRMATQTPSIDDLTLVRLPDLPLGKAGRVVRVEGDPSFCRRMKELGLIEAVAVAVQQVNGSVLCRIKNSRFGISRDAAENIWVETLK